MARVKRGTTVRARHKRLLKKTRGYKHRRRVSVKLAKQAFLKAGEHAYRHRREKKRTFRGLWIVQVNAAVRPHGLSYSRFISGLNKAKITLNRKVLAELSQTAPEEFTKIVFKAKTALAKPSESRAQAK